MGGVLGPPALGEARRGAGPRPAGPGFLQALRGSLPAADTDAGCRARDGEPLGGQTSAKDVVARIGGCAPATRRALFGARWRLRPVAVACRGAGFECAAFVSIDLYRLGRDYSPES